MRSSCGVHDATDAPQGGLPLKGGRIPIRISDAQEPPCHVQIGAGGRRIEESVHQILGRCPFDIKVIQEDCQLPSVFTMLGRIGWLKTARPSPCFNRSIPSQKLQLIMITKDEPRVEHMAPARSKRALFV